MLGESSLLTEDLHPRCAPATNVLCGSGQDRKRLWALVLQVPKEGHALGLLKAPLSARFGRFFPHLNDRACQCLRRNTLGPVCGSPFCIIASGGSSLLLLNVCEYELPHLLLALPWRVV